MLHHDTFSHLHIILPLERHLKDGPMTSEIIVSAYHFYHRDHSSGYNIHTGGKTAHATQSYNKYERWYDGLIYKGITSNLLKGILSSLPAL